MVSYWFCAGILDLRRDLFHENLKGKLQASPTGIAIELLLQVENDGNQNPQDDATQNISDFTTVPEGPTNVPGTVETAINDLSSYTDTWGPLLRKVEIFSEVVDKIAEVYPILSAFLTWSE
jgi:hypothetical protein